MSESLAQVHPAASTPVNDLMDNDLENENLPAPAAEQEQLRLLERQYTRQAETFREVARILNSSLDQPRVLELILDQLAKVVEYDGASIMLLDGDRFSIAAARKFQTLVQTKIPDRVAIYPHIQEALESRRPVIILDTHEDSRWQPYPQSAYIRCWLGAPLVGRDGVIGLLNLNKVEPHYYSPSDADLAATFASHAAIAIENARLYSIEHQRTEQLNALRATIADISAELELPRLLQAILQRAVILCKATGGDLGLTDETRGAIRIMASHNMGKDYTGTIMAQGEGAMGQAYKNNAPVNIEDYQNWEHASEQYHGVFWHAVLAVPILFGQRTIGAIGIVDADPNRRFTSSNQELLAMFAQHAAIAVENARLYEAARSAAERRSVLHQVSQEIVCASLQPEQIYLAIHKAAARLMTAEAFVITRHTPKSGYCTAVYEVDKDQRFPGGPYPADQGLFGLIMATGSTISLGDLLQTSDRFPHFGSNQSVRAVLAAPMRLRGDIVGMISTQSYQPHAYTADDQALLEMLASYAAIALDNAGLFQHIEKLATTDPLTGLFNRRHLFELGQREYVRACRFNRPLAAMMLDIDHFKQINDRFSHATGDRVLVHLAQVLHANIREIDIIGKYGGEEFGVVLPEAGLDTALEIANRLQEQIHLSFLHKSLPAVTISIGIAILEADVDDFNDLLHHADLAMYVAKNSGRNRVATYED